MVARRGSCFHEIVRQQLNFSSPYATRETEEYAVDLSNVTLLDLIIDPDKENRKARAPILSLHLAWRPAQESLAQNAATIRTWRAVHLRYYPCQIC